MKVLSLFDGISCCRVALERAGVPVSRYVAYETDPHAINVSLWNCPEAEHMGDVTDGDFRRYKGFDLVTGGFPCQDLSIAGKRAGLKGKRSSLFWYLADAIETITPRYFLVENNKGMPEEAKRTITRALGVEPIEINSALVSAQNRRRLYWTNIKTDLPEDRGIKLRDVLKKRVHEKYFLSDKAVEYLRRAKMNQRYIQCEFDTKARCLTANYYKGIPYNVLAVFQRPRGFNRGNFYTEKSPAVTSKAWSYENFLMLEREGDIRFRRLTPEECERLQGLPDGYTEMIPETQRYKVLGNGWNIDTITHIFNDLQRT